MRNLIPILKKIARLEVPIYKYYFLAEFNCLLKLSKISDYFDHL